MLLCSSLCQSYDNSNLYSNICLFLSQGAAFIIASYLATSILLILSSCLFLSPIFTGYQILWVMWIICPILALSFLFNPHEADTMTTMTGKNNEHLKDFKPISSYDSFCRSVSVLLCLLVHCIISMDNMISLLFSDLMEMLTG